MNNKKINEAVASLAQDTNITINPLALQMASSYMANGMRNIDRESEFAITFLQSMKYFNCFLEMLPEYYKAGEKLTDSLPTQALHDQSGYGRG